MIVNNGLREMIDPLQHPDLVELAHRMRHQLDSVLQAEQEAAATSMRRRRLLRDRLLDADDRSESVTVTDASGHSWKGSVTGVGVDHFTLDGRTFIVLDQCVSVEFDE